MLVQAKPVGSHNTNFATRKELLAPARPVNQMESVPLDDLINMEGPGGSPGSDLMRSWFSGFLLSREIAEIDRAIRGEAGDGASSPAEEPAPKGPFGPLQVRHSLPPPLQALHACLTISGNPLGTLCCSLVRFLGLLSWQTPGPLESKQQEYSQSDLLAFPVLLNRSLVARAARLFLDPGMKGHLLMSVSLSCSA